MTEVATNSQARPTIGDILLAHGFVSSDDLAAAIEEQGRTGQPLGQILVTRGSITRLELASALAEQWSMAPPLERPEMVAAAGGRSPMVIDDDTYAVRVQSAVSDLARRVGATEPLLAEIERRAADSVSPDELEPKLAELRARIELSLVRINALESGLAANAERIEEMTESVEQAFADMQSGTGELAERLAEIATSLAQQPHAAEISALQEAVAELAARPEGDPTLPGRVEEVAADAAAGVAAIEDLRAELADLGTRPTVEATVAPRLEELEQRLASLADSSVEVARVADVEARLAGLASTEERLVELEQRPAISPADDAIEALRAELHELAARPAGDPDLERRVTEQLQELSQRPIADIGLPLRLDELAAELEHLRVAQSAEPQPDARVDALVEDVARLASRLESVTAIAGAGERGPEIDELRGALDELARRRSSDEETAQRLEVVAADVAELAARPAGTDGLAERVDELAVALGSIVSAGDVAELRAQLEEVVVRQAAALHTDERLADLAYRLDELDPGQADAALERLREDVERRLGDAVTVTEQRAAAALEAVQSWSTEQERLSSRLDELALAIGTTGSAEPPASTGRSDSTTEREVERQRLAIERLGLHLGEHERALAEMMRTRGVTERLEELAVRVEELATAGAGGAGAAPAAPPSGTGPAELHAELRALARRIDDAEAAVQADREKQLTRLDRMASSIDWRLQRLEAGDEAVA